MHPCLQCSGEGIKRKVKWVGRATWISDACSPVTKPHSPEQREPKEKVFQQAWGLKGTNPKLLRLSSRFILVHLAHTVAFESAVQTPGFRKVTASSERLHCVNQTTCWRPGADGVGLLQFVMGGLTWKARNYGVAYPAETSLNQLVVNTSPFYWILLSIILYPVINCS